MRRGPLLALLALGLGTAGTVRGQAGPITGTVSVRFLPSAASLQPGQEFGIDVSIDLTGVTGLGCDGSPMPVILGGFQIPMEFDRARLDFLGAENSPTVGNPSCPSARPDPFPRPYATSAADANATGTAFFDASNGVNILEPTGGPYCYFRIRFRARPTNAGVAPALVRFRRNDRSGYSLSSNLIYCGSSHLGPASLQLNPDVTVALTTTPVELVRFRAD